MTTTDREDAERGDDDPHDSQGEAPADGRRGARILTIAGWTVIGVLVLGVVWVVVTGLVARSRLNDARSQIGALRSAVTAGDVPRAQRLVSEIAEKAGSAHSLTSGPAWWVASNVPVLGSPLRTSRVIAAQADRLGGDVLPGVVRLLRTIPSESTSSLTSINLSPIAAAVPDLDKASAAATAASRTVASTEGSWLSAVSSARDSFASQLTQLDGELAGADRAVHILLPMLGQQSRQRYFVGFLNEAESRGGGGIPGAFAIVTTDRGRIRFERFGSDDDLKGSTARVELGKDFDARYQGNDPLGTFQNSNLSPDFSYAGRIWAGMWQAKTGERIDGALAVDPTALSYLLRVTGPARLASGGTVSADNVVALTQQEQYRRFPGTTKQVSDERKAYLIGLARGISTHLTGGGGDPARLVKAVSRAAGERRFVVWSRYPAVETNLREAGWSGALGLGRAGPFSGFVVNNAGGNKLDYYLRRSMSYRRSSCAAGGTATATIALTNNAPRSGLPKYVTLRADAAAGRARPGDNRLLLTYYADRSAKITSLTVDGQRVPAVAVPEGNTLAATTTIELPVRATVIVTATIAEPRADGPVTVLRQPGVAPLQVDLAGDRCR